MKTLKVLDNICEGIIKVLRIVIIVLVAVMTIVIFANVINRSIFKSSLNWSDGMARYIMIIYVFLAGAIATYRDNHIEIDIVPNFFAKHFKRFNYRIIINILIIISMVWFLTFSSSYIIAATKTRQLAPQLNIPMYYLYSITFLSPCLCIFFAAVNTFRNILGMFCKKEED